MSSGETDLALLLRQLAPERQPGVYVFVSTREPEVAPRTTRIAAFREAEGATQVLPRAAADHYGLTCDYEAAWITLQVHFSLAAVGLTAAVATALAEAGISCHIMAGYYHDHLFVDLAMVEKALATLAALRAFVADQEATAGQSFFCCRKEYDPQ